MAQFRIRIAGQTASVTSLFESTRDYCRAYLTDGPAELSIAVTAGDLRFEQAELDAEAAREGFRPRMFTDPFLERAAIQRKFAAHLFSRDVLLLHGSAIAVDGRGYLFAARSGTGKSTHTRLWREQFGSRAVTVNDDKPFVQVRPGGIFLCGAPWSGKHGLDANITVPLCGICLLERGSENRIVPAAPSEALAQLLPHCCPPLDHDPAALNAMLERILAQTPLWRMTCTKGPEAAIVAYGAMGKESI